MLSNKFTRLCKQPSFVFNSLNNLEYIQFHKGGKNKLFNALEKCIGLAKIGIEKKENI